MIQTTLSRNGYKIKKSDLSSNQLKSVKDDLTVNPYVVGDFGNGNEKRFSLYMESPNSIYIPRFYAYEEFGKPSKSKMDEGHDIKINFNGSLRPEQLPIIDLYREACEEKGGGLISLKCGGGKTVLALYIISLLKKKTIVIVHKDFLMTQWRDRIQQFLPEARIGKIQQNTIDIENKDIVLAMVQSLSQKEYDQSVFSSFGLAIFDECHHLVPKYSQNQWRKSPQNTCWDCRRHPIEKMVLGKYLNGISVRWSIRQNPINKKIILKLVFMNIQMMIITTQKKIKSIQNTDRNRVCPK
jgi:type I site-specific restriction endonuclease